MRTVEIGIVLGLAGSIAINTGNNLQSLGMYTLEMSAAENDFIEKNEKNDRNLCSSKTWVFGTAIFISGALLNFASYGFAPQSTLASLESIQFVSNLFLGKLLLKKKVTNRMYLGTFLTVGGTVLAVSFSSKEAAMVEVVTDLEELWENELWIGYIIFIVVLAMLLHYAYEMYKNQKNKQNVIAVVYSVFSALWGTLSVVFAKLLAQLVDLWMDDVQIFMHWFTYATLFSWMVLMMYWLYRLNSALGLYNPMFIIPLLQSNFIFFAIVSGGIYFKEFNYMGKGEWVGFVAGIISMFTGIALLVPPKDPVKGDTKVGMSKDSPIKNLMTKFMTGAGRMNQQSFDIKTQKDIYDLRLQELEKKEILNQNELKLTVLLRNYIGGADKTLTRESELRDMLNVKYIQENDCGKVKDLMQTVQRFKLDLDKADRAISKCSDRARHNRSWSTPGHYKLWSFRTNPSFSDATPDLDSESEDQIDDTGAKSNNKQADDEHKSSVLEDNSSKV